MRTINRIIIHCSYTYPDQDIGVEEIRKWHTDPNKKGGPYRDIGYHYVIRRNGVTEKGRPEEEAGAHVQGHNADSIGICLVGGKGRNGIPGTNFTMVQWWELSRLVRQLENKYPEAKVSGHNNWTGSKTCPTFDVRAWRYE